MIFGNKTLYTTNEILDALLESGDIKNSTGAVSVVRKEGRKTVASGKIFFRNELIYAVEIANRPVPIAKRVQSGGLVDSDDLESIVLRVGDGSSPRVVDQLLVGQLISEKNLNAYVKEHFIDALGHILSWDNSIGEWHPNATTSDFVMPYVSVEKVRMILENRKSFRHEFSTAVRSFFRESEIDSLSFVNHAKTLNEFAPEVKAILKLANGEETAADIAFTTGITQFSVFQTIIALWKKGIVSLRLGGIQLTFASVLETTRNAKENPLEKTWLPAETVVPLSDANDENLSQAKDEIDVKAEALKATAEAFVQKTSDYEDVEISEEPEEEVVESPAEEDKEADETDDPDFLPNPLDSEVSEDVNDTDEFLTVDENEEKVEDEQEDDGFTDESPSPADDESEAEPHLENDVEALGNLPELIELERLDHEYQNQRTEETVTTASNIPASSVAHQKISGFTAELGRLQQNISDAESEIATSELAVEEAASTLHDAKTALEKAQDSYQSAVDAKAKSHEKYTTACSSVEKLIQSFKISD